MKFEYKDSHKIVRNEELIDDLKATARKLNVSSLSMKEYDENGQYILKEIKLYAKWGN